MAGWLAALALVWGTTCGIEGSVAVSDREVTEPSLVAWQAANPDDARPPLCVDGGAPGKRAEWPAHGRFWIPLALDPAARIPPDTALAVRMVGSAEACVFWPVGGDFRPQCRSINDGLGLTHRFAFPDLRRLEEPIWIRIDGSLYLPPGIGLGPRIAVERHERVAELRYGVYYGLLVAIAALGLVAWGTQRLATYAWFSGFMLCFSATVAGFTGRGLTLLATLPTEWLATGPLLGVLASTILLLGFSRAYVEPDLEPGAPWRVVSALILGICVVGLAPVIVFGEAVLHQVALLAAATAIAVLVHAARLTAKGSLRGRYLLQSFAPLGLGLVLGGVHVLTGSYHLAGFSVMLTLAGAVFMPLVLVHGAYQRNRKVTRDRDQARGELMATQRLALLRALYCRVTGLPRRQKLGEMFDNMAAGLAGKSNANIGIYVVQIDNLSDVRQHHGREALDAMMTQLAGRLRDGLGEHQVVGRLDDWDLVVMVPIVDPPDGHRARALNAAQNMLACTEQSVPWRGSAITPSASVGVALWPHQGATFGELLRRCDAALYDAQARGGKRIRLYSESAYLQRADRWTRIQDLGEAMKQGQLEMHYQPIHDGRTGGLIGLEGLVRWRQLDGTLILPGDFVPLAEESDLIMDLGYWTVATAIEDLGWMARAGLSTPFLSLNVSPRQLVGDVFVTQVSTLLRNAGIAPGRIHIEITETSLVEGFERTRRLLARMGDAGLRVYVDDFGVGYSSLSYLRELPIHGLKIDKSFVENIGRTDQDETVLGTVLKLADGLGLDIIAEGVETTYQKQFLLERDCHRLQGHLFALPMPREALVTYARGDYAARLETA